MPYEVTSWSWSQRGGPGGLGELVCQGPVVAAGALTNWRPLAVMPPAPGKKNSYLIVGSCGKPELRVIALPSLTLVHTHVMEGMEIWRLAADPRGGALALYDNASHSVHVLAWPLPGMPPLE